MSLARSALRDQGSKDTEDGSRPLYLDVAALDKRSGCWMAVRVLILHLEHVLRILGLTRIRDLHDLFPAHMSVVHCVWDRVDIDLEPCGFGARLFFRRHL